MGEGAGEKGLPAVALGDVEAHPHGRRVLLDVEPHLDTEGVDGQTKGAALARRWRWATVATHVISVDQRADRLQGAEGVILAVALAAAGVPDQVAALLIGQHVGRRPLKEHFQKLKGRKDNSSSPSN